MSHLEALSSHKRRTENEDREWVLLLLAGSALLPQRTSLWTRAQSRSCTEMPQGLVQPSSLSLQVHLHAAQGLCFPGFPRGMFIFITF